MEIKALINNYLHSEIKTALSTFLLTNDDKLFQEIRIRLNKPLEIKYNSKNYLLSKNGTTTKDINNALIIVDEIFINTLNKICQHSIYAFQDELKNGFITLKGGHRVGVVGSCVMENGHIKSIKDINSLNIRLSHDIVGISKSVSHIYNDDITNTLIISPPASGKTTLLRDLLRYFSDDLEKTIGVVDERYELCTTTNIGIRTDVITNCPKSIAMITLLRTMSPYAICLDEIGTTEDIKAVQELFNCGVKVVATIHAKDIIELQKKSALKELLATKSFDNYIVLNPDFTKKPKIYNKDFLEV